MPIKKQNFLTGVVILTAATMLVKVIGIFYKIPLGNILGAVGMSYFMTAYNIFSPIYALSVAGFPLAVSKMVAESSAQNRYREAKKIFHCSYGLFVVTGIIGSLIMFFGADLAARLVNNPDAALAVKAMAPAIFFCCIVSAYRGYYQGLGNMAPTAISQVIESLFKLVCGIVFAVLLLNRAITGYEAGNLVFGGVAVSREQAELLALPWAAAGAIFGVTISSIISAIYLMIHHARTSDGISRDVLESSPKPNKSSVILKNLMRFALPVCIGSVLTQVTSLIDVATIMNRISVATARGGDVILLMYRGLIPPEVTLEAVPRFLYGAYSYCSSLFNLVPALTIPLGISALPLVSSYWATHERARIAGHVQSVIKLSALISIPAGLGLTALAEPILELLYPARISEVALAAPILQSLGLAAVFLGITTPISSIFQAVGRADIPVKLMAVGAGLKLVMNYILLAIPSLNIKAAPYGTIVCYFFIFIAGILFLQNILKTEINLVVSFFKPLFCAIICAVTAHTSYGLLEKVVSSRVSCLVSIIIGGIIYSICVLFLRIITKNEILLLSNGRNIVKRLEKLKLLG